MSKNIERNVGGSIDFNSTIKLKSIHKYFKKNIWGLIVLAGLGIFNSFSGLIFKGWYSVPVNLGLNAIMVLIGLIAIIRVKEITRG
jgi:hypothetical protein